MKKHVLLFVSFCIAFNAVADGQNVLTFDEFPTGGLFTITQIPNGYGGLSWNNFYAGSTTLPSGYINGTVSAPNVAVNGNGNPASFSSTSSFTLISGYFTAAWNNGLTLEVMGLNGATTEYSNTYTLNTSGPLLIDFPSASVTEVEFISSGGTPAGFQNGAGTEFALDNLTVGAIPDATSTAFLFTTGLGALTLLRKWRNA